MRNTNPTKRRRLERVSIRAERHDQPDWDRFAFALLQYAKSLSESKPEPKHSKGRAKS
jgi:hypothetical protein